MYNYSDYSRNQENIPGPAYRPDYQNQYDWRNRPMNFYRYPMHPVLKVLAIFLAIWLVVGIIHGIFHFFWPILIIAGIIYLARRRDWHYRPYYGHRHYYRHQHRYSQPYYYPPQGYQAPSNSQPSQPSAWPDPADQDNLR